MNPMTPDLYRRIKAQNRRLNEAERELKRARFASYPTMIQIEPTNRCLFTCPTCARSYYDPKLNVPGDFPEELLGKLKPAFAFAETVLLGGYGEPLIGKPFRELVGMAADYACHIEVISNGQPLDEPMITFLCGMGVDRLRLSVDAASDVEMMQMRGITLSDILTRIDLIREIGGFNAPRIAFNVTLNINNLDHLVPLVSLAATHEVDQVVVAHQKIYTEDQVPDSVFHHLDQAQQVFDEAVQQARLQQVELALPPLEGIRPCHQPLEMIMVGHDGLVQGCCSALFGGGQPRLDLGSLDTDDVHVLWNAPLMQQARTAAYEQGEWPEPCQNCGFRVYDADSHLRLMDKETGP